MILLYALLWLPLECTRRIIMMTQDFAILLQIIIKSAQHLANLIIYNYLVKTFEKIIKNLSKAIFLIFRIIKKIFITYQVKNPDFSLQENYCFITEVNYIRFYKFLMLEKQEQNYAFVFLKNVTILSFIQKYFC